MIRTFDVVGSAHSIRYLKTLLRIVGLTSIHFSRSLPLGGAMYGPVTPLSTAPLPRLRPLPRLTPLPRFRPLPRLTPLPRLNPFPRFSPLSSLMPLPVT